MRESDYALNPFERAILPHLFGEVLDLGCGLGNLSLATTYMNIFDPAASCLFGRDELSTTFAGWETLLSRHEDFPAPGETVKAFHTLVARRSGAFSDRSAP